MICIPKDYSNNFNFGTNDKFIALLEMINALNEALQYPNCECKEDTKRILARFENELILKGYL